MKVTFLGTGTSQGVPPIGCKDEVCLSKNPKDKRLRTSIHIECEGKSLIVDTGPDFRYQCIRAGIEKVDAILFTHEHRDHTAGLDDIRPFYFKLGYPMPVFAHPRVQQAIKDQYSYMFSGIKYPGIPEVGFNSIDKAHRFEVEGIPVTPIEVMHYKLPVLGFRIHNFTYITDVNFITDDELEKAMGTEILVLGALRKTEHLSHFSLPQAVEVAKKVGAKQTYFIHMSFEMGFHDEVNLELPEGMELAYDGLVLEM